MSSRAPERSRAVSAPPCPSGFSKTWSRRSSIIRPSKSKLGTIDWQKKKMSVGGSPKSSLTRKKLRVAEALARPVELLGLDREERAIRDRADREGALRARESEPAGLAAGHHHHADAPLGQDRLALGRRLLESVGVSPAPGQRDHIDRLEEGGFTLGTLPAGVIALDRTIEIDGIGLKVKSLALALVQILPEAEDMDLAARLEPRLQLLELGPFGAVRRHLAPLD